MLSVSRISFAQTPSLIKRTTNNMSQPLKYDTVSFGSLPPALPGNFGEVVAGKLFRRAMPNINQLNALKQKGVTAIISLLDPNDGNDIARIVEKEVETAKRLGIKFVSMKLPLPVPKYYAAEMPKLVETINQLMKEGPVYVHCEYGRSRTGQLMAAYQHFSLGMKPEEILAQGHPYESDYAVGQFFSFIARANKPH